MGNQQLTGWLKKQMLQQKHEHPDDHEWDFDEYYCAAEIQNQPDPYTGPQRYCRGYTLKKRDEDGNVVGRFNRCRKHNGAAHKNWQKGLEAADGAEENNVRAMTHGMYAEDTNLKKNWSDADQNVYDQVMEWAEDYGFEEGSPAFMQLESLAMSKIRELRSEKFLNENGEVVEKEVWNPEAERMEEWEEVHDVSEALRLKKKTIIAMMKELGLTPKAAASMDRNTSEASAADAVAEMASDALDDEDAEYDPEQFADE